MDGQAQIECISRPSPQDWGCLQAIVALAKMWFCVLGWLTPAHIVQYGRLACLERESRPLKEVFRPDYMQVDVSKRKTFIKTSRRRTNCKAISTHTGQ